MTNPSWKNNQDWETYCERINIERENKKESDEKSPLLLCDIFIMVLRIYRYIEKTTKDITLVKILLAIYYHENLSQADIAKLYDIPVGTIGNIIAKHTTARKTKTGNVKNNRNKNNSAPLIELVKDKNHRNRQILKLTDEGTNKAQKILSFINTTFYNIRNTEGKTLDAASTFLEPMMKELSRLCRCTTGTNDTLNMLTKYKKPHA